MEDTLLIVGCFALIIGIPALKAYLRNRAARQSADYRQWKAEYKAKHKPATVRS